MTFDVFSEFATDSSLEINGTWRDLGKGARILVARANNREYGRLLNKLYDQHKEVLDREGEEADAKSAQIMGEVISKTILKGWEGISYKGAAMTYSHENAQTLLVHDDFRALVMRKANEVDSYKMVQEADQGKA